MLVCQWIPTHEGAHYEFLKRDSKFFNFYTEYYYCDNKAFNDFHDKYAVIIFKKLFNIEWAKDDVYQHLNIIALTSVASNLGSLYSNAEITLYETITYIINMVFKLTDFDERFSYDEVKSFVTQFIESDNYVKYDVYNDLIMV